MAHATLVNFSATVLNLNRCVWSKHSKRVATAQAQEALVTLNDFSQLKPHTQLPQKQQIVERKAEPISATAWLLNKRFPSTK